LIVVFLEPFLAAAELGQALALAQSFDRIHIRLQRRDC
jgi:hypothetical protein